MTIMGKNYEPAYQETMHCRITTYADSLLLPVLTSSRAEVIRPLAENRSRRISVFWVHSF